MNQQEIAEQQQRFLEERLKRSLEQRTKTTLFQMLEAGLLSYSEEDVPMSAPADVRELLFKERKVDA